MPRPSNVKSHTRHTTQREPLTIHARLTWDRHRGADPKVWELFTPYLSTRQLRQGHIQSAEHHDRFRFGAVIGVVQHACCFPWSDHGLVWHRVVTDPVLLNEPVPCPGRLSLFDVPAITLPADRHAS